MDSDSDLQAYINELSRKTHDLKYGDHESTSSDEPEPSHSSYIEIAVKKADVEIIEKQSTQTSKVKELEEKYLKRTLKSRELTLSSSFSEYNPEFEEEKLNTDNINTFPDETTIDSSAKANETKNIKPTQIHKTLNPIDNNRSTKQIVNLKSHSFEEDIKEDSYRTSQNSSQRKLSENSLLLNKSNIFYSKNEKAGRQKPTGKVIFRMRSNTLSESDTIKTDVTSTVSEEIPELMQNEMKETTKNNQMPTEDKDESNNYEENTFEHSEDSSTIKDESSSSKLTSEEALSQKSDSESVTESAVSEQALPEMLERDDISDTVMSSKGHSSTSPTEETNESPNNPEKSDDVTSQDDSTQNTSVESQEGRSIISQDDSSQSTSVKSQADRSSSNESSSTTRESDESSIQHIHQKIKKGHHKSKNKIEYRTPESSPKPSRSRAKDIKKEKRENNVNKRSKMEHDFSSSTSLSASVVTSSSSSSFSVKMKKKKYREKKRKMKQEKELTELIIKLLIKNLPMILRQTLGVNSTAELLHQQPRSYICHHCGGNSVGFDMTQKRIDDALRQTVDLTKHFLESQRAMMETQYTHLNTNYKYTTLKNYST